MKDISLILAFSAGLLSFLSPCVLPMVPAYISYLTGVSIKELKDERPKLLTIYQSIGFIVGFSFVFILMGASATSLGTLFLSHREMLRRIGGVIIIIFGIHTMGIVKVKALYREKRFLHPDSNKNPFRSILLGMAFAAGWTPCIGPILSSILIYAANEASLGKGIALLGSYSMGMAVPFLLMAVAIGSIGNQIKKLAKYYTVISVISGAFLIVMGVLVYSNKLVLLSRYFNFISS